MYLRLLLSSLLILRALSQFQNDPDWWIYVPVYAVGASLGLLRYPESILWRTASSLVILSGAALTAFLIWVMNHLRGAVTSEQFHEGRNILPVAAALAMTAGVRLQSAQYRNIFAYPRTAILLIALFIAVSGIAYSLIFYTNNFSQLFFSFSLLC